MRKNYRLSEGRIVECEDPEAQILVFNAPTDAEKAFLVGEFKIDEHTLNSSLDPDELSRLEFEPEHAALIINRPKNYCREDQFLFKVASTGLFLFKTKLVVVMADDATVFDGSKTFARIASLPDAALRILFRSIFHFLGHLKVINAISDELEQKINMAMENRYLINLFALEKSLVYLVNAIHTNGTLIERMRHNAARLGFSVEEQELLDDIHIENTECGKQAEIYANIITGMMDARVSIVSNNLNIMMKNLNALVIAVAIPSFFASMGGMSELTTLTGAEWKIAYPLFMLAMIGLGSGTFYLVRYLEKYWH